MNKTVAITGSTGGIASEIVKELARKDYNLILINRNESKTNTQIDILRSINPNISITFHKADMSNLDSVKETIEYLKGTHFDYLIINSAIYNVKVEKLDCGYNNIFFVNCIAPLLLVKGLKEKTDITRFIVIGSISYKFAKLNKDDLDYSNCTHINKIYGNSKRCLMFSLFKEFENDDRLSIAHPGIVYTNMTNHYPKWINWFISFGLRVLMPSAHHASIVILKSFEYSTHYLEWIGPSIFNIWGKGNVKRIKDVDEEEIKEIHKECERVLNELM